MKKPKIISCFPHIGRSYAINHLPNKTIANLDENRYKFADQDRNPNGYGIRQISKWWPRPYIYRIKELMEDESIDYILIGADSKVRQTLSDLYIRYEVVIPCDWDKFITGLKERNTFIENEDKLYALYQDCKRDFHKGELNVTDHLYDILRDVDTEIAYWHVTGDNKNQGNFIKVIGITKGNIETVVYQDLSADNSVNEIHVIDYCNFFLKNSQGYYDFIETSYSPDDVINGVPFKTKQR